MNVIDAIKSRRSIKAFDPDYQLSADQLKQLQDVSTYCPTSYNLQHWRIIRITDVELRKKIRSVSSDQAQVTDASELFIICGDLKAWEKDPSRFWKDADTDRRNFVVKLIASFYKNREWMQRDEVMRSGSLVAQTLMLAARGLELGSCPMIGFEQDAVAELINLPNDHLIVMMLAIGKAAAPPRKRGSHLGVDFFYKENTF